MSEIGTYELHSTYKRHGFKTRFVLSRSKACQSMTQELEMVDESFKKNMFQLARILICPGQVSLSFCDWIRKRDTSETY